MSTKADRQYNGRRELVACFIKWEDYCYIPVYFLDMLICRAWIDWSYQYFNIWETGVNFAGWNTITESIYPLLAIMAGKFYEVSPLFAFFKAKKIVERNLCVWEIILMWLRLVTSSYMWWYGSCSWVEVVVMVKFYGYLLKHLEVIK